MTLEPEDYPLTAQDQRIFTRRNAKQPVLVAIDAEMATFVADRLNRTADVVFIDHLDLGNPAQVERFMRERDAGKR